ncbi:molybdenum cofactor guanylyltransferase [Aureimonas psammosilenae]|uniref:molybdenum cofactor guanylyltransferase n=1 Tax=Aureimonas psammosilenae TaxID=2495496 RepID=UPI0012603E8E|nr:NTP transferase domain-containing protein [Aureimonas psammosilenae]
MNAPRIAGLVLAGGRGSRLGSAVPKPLVPLAGSPLLARVLDRFAGAVEPVLVNANDTASFAQFDLPVVSDRLPDFPGPLAGLDAAAAWLADRRPDVAGLVCLPGDTPFLPLDIVTRLAAGPSERVRLAGFAGRLQPTIGFWPLARLAGLKEHITASENRSVIGFAEARGFDTVSFATDMNAPGGDPFFNVNTPNDLEIAETWLSR